MEECKKAFVTGCTGFVGSHLIELLLSKGYMVYGLVRFRADFSNIRHIKDKIKFYVGDITDISSIKRALKESKPHEIYHLAANSFVPYSWTQPIEVLNTNVIGTINLFEAVRDLDINPKIHIAASSEEYGMVKENEVPITEDQPLRPLSPYGVSKITMDLLGQQYVASYGMNIFITRAFNHTGPRRGESFVCSHFAKQIVEIELGKRECLEHGNLDAVRDFTDVRDIVRAYVLGLNNDNIAYGEPYNLATGKGYQISEVLAILTKMAKAEIKTRLDPAKARPSDVPLLIGDSSKFRKTIGWKPEIEFETTMKDLLDYWRNVLK